MKVINYLFLSLLIISLTACESDNNIPLNANTDIDGANAFIENFGNTIQARFIGTVVDENSDPIAGVTITIGSDFAITDSYGIFSISAGTVYEKFAYIKAEKPGFINGSRALMPTSGTNQVKIMLLNSDPTEVIVSGQQETIALPGGTEVTLPGAYETELGLAYTGDVSVTVKFLSPDNENMTLQMPGALVAENADGDLRVLETLGMIAVILKGENGEKLNIASGTTATIKVPVASAITNPPATVPLWSFNETFGYWEEDGLAFLQGDYYSGEVSHFSFWNVDVPFATVELCVTLVDDANNTINNQYVILKRAESNGTSTSNGFTNANGEICGFVPSNEELILSVRDFGCVTNHVNIPIGPFSSDQELTLTVTEEVSLSTSLMGQFNNCDGNAINNGYLKIYYSGVTQIIPVTNGNIEELFVYCSTSDAFTIQGVDLESNQATEVTVGTFVNPVTNLAAFMSCVALIDTDGDQILDINEDVNGDNNIENDDTDGDGIPNYQDPDDDGDGVLTKDEDYDGDNNPMNEDTDGDNLPDYLDRYDGLELYSDMRSINCAPDFMYDLQNQNFVNYIIYNDVTSFHTTPADANANVNPLPSMYSSSSFYSIIYARSLNTISNRLSYSEVNLIESYEDFYDSDGDGLTNCEEWTGIPNGFSTCQRNLNFSYESNSDVSDSDGDGYNDCVEAQAGTDPMDNFNAAPVRINISDVTLTEGTNQTVGISLSNPATSTIVLNLNYSNNDDLLNMQTTVSIAAGNITGSFELQTIDDTTVEATDEITIEFTINQGVVASITSPMTVTMVDND